MREQDLSLRASALEPPTADGDTTSLTSQAATAPEILIDEPGLRLWHKLDAKFLTPRANVFCAITTTSAYDSARSAVLSSLAMKLIEDALNETSYLADVAGLHAAVYPAMYRLSVKVDGFNDKLPKLLERICKEVVSHQVRRVSTPLTSERAATDNSAYAPAPAPESRRAWSVL